MDARHTQDNEATQELSHAELLEILSKFDLLERDENGLTALMKSIKLPDCVAVILQLARERNQLQTVLDAEDNNGVTALMIAVYYGELEAIKQLVDAGASLIRENKLGVLHCAQMPETCELLISKAREKGILEKLITTKDVRNNTAFSHFCIYGEAELAQVLLPVILDYKNGAFQYMALGKARSAYFDYPEKSQIFDDISSALGRNFLKRFKDNAVYDSVEGVLHLEESVISVQQAYQILFNSSGMTEVHQGENEIDYVISQLYALFQNITQCNKYLKMINEDFVDYYQQKHSKKFPLLDLNSVRFMPIDGYYYPIPRPHYQKINKQHSLQEFFIFIFRQYGLAEKAYKWIGFLPDQIGNKLIKQGIFFTEDQLGSGLFHTKIAHMVHWAILLYWMKEQKINFNMQDIFAKLVSCKFGNRNIWVPLFDTNERDSLSFHGPHTMMTFVMKYGEQAGYRELQHYAIDTFCNGIKKLLTTLKSYPAYAQLNLDQLVSKADELELRLVSFDAATKYSLEQEKKKSSVFYIVNEEKGYGVVEKTYHPNLFFKWKRNEKEVNPDLPNDIKKPALT
jgi:ankyrin repeat protein